MIIATLVIITIAALLAQQLRMLYDARKARQRLRRWVK